MHLEQFGNISQAGFQKACHLLSNLVLQDPHDKSIKDCLALTINLGRQFYVNNVFMYTYIGETPPRNPMITMFDC